MHQQRIAAQLLLVAVLGDLASWVQDVIERLGAVGVALLVILENVFPPIPSEIVLPFAGFVAQRGDGSVVVMIFAATLGAVVGALVLYGIAAVIGPERLAAFVARFGRWFGVKPADLVRAEQWFDRHAVAAVLLGRCVPLIRSIVSIPAGFRRMAITPFLLYTALGSLVWNTALIGAGAILGNQWERVEPYVATLQWVVVAAVALLVLRFVFGKLRRRA
ncbi:MAG: DedA family protein [Actinobacteria bacterium]|nr:DedA family protein [Actinomycetota bacterium]NDE20474.1 DedA family protein [Actinomycetota bacterium]NDG10802.1 DedA family protein [Actinomycetota bacterium]